MSMQFEFLRHGYVPIEPIQAPIRRVSPRIRYIGSKARVSESILAIIGNPKNEKERFVDLFCGSGSVGYAAAKRGWCVHANDHLISSVIVSYAQLIGREQVDFLHFDGYEGVIEALNATKPIKGTIYKEYSPSGVSKSKNVRKYFTEENAAKIDGVRKKIEAFYASGVIGKIEHSLLIADLISAANGVANIAGTYGCFLSKWSANALSALKLVPRSMDANLPSSSHSSEDAFAFQDLESDVLYCDPPYTKRQYAAYYHLIETIALGDYPKVYGVAGIRAWEHKSSPFCYKRRALNAFSELLTSKRAKRIYVSYSSEGHLALEELLALLSQHGSVRLHEIKSIPRYAPNEVARSKNNSVTEYLIELTR